MSVLVFGATATLSEGILLVGQSAVSTKLVSQSLQQSFYYFLSCYDK